MILFRKNIKYPLYDIEFKTGHIESFYEQSYIILEDKDIEGIW